MRQATSITSVTLFFKFMISIIQFSLSVDAYFIDQTAANIQSSKYSGNDIFINSFENSLKIVK